MTRQSAEKKDFSFVAGLNTEAGYLTFPPNTWLEGDNVTPNVDGSITRRLKIDFEEGYEQTASYDQTTKELKAVTLGQWSNVAGIGTLNFAVVQIGKDILFYDTSSTSVSTEVKSFSIDLVSYKVANTSILGTSQISVASGNGKLIIVSGDTEVLLVSYNEVSDSITVTTLNLKIRDFYGVDDTLSVDERPATLSANHNYNLLNQGWTSTNITTYFTADTLYPSNAQIWTEGKNSSDVFDAALLDKQNFGTSPAPKGRFILDLFNRDRTTVSGVANVTTETENYRPTTTAFFAGRAWYSGVSSPTISSWVLFSRVADQDSKYEQCYQEADPTSEYISDLIASDGGVIPIPEAGNIIKLLPIQDSLIVFAENGIWQILGDGRGFRADGYQVKKISSFGCVSSASVVEVETSAVFWSNSGIFTFQKDSVSGDFATVSLTLEKIQSDYNSISPQAKKYSQGFYFNEEKKIIWLYNSSPNANSAIDRFKKDKFLIFDTRLQAFYKYTIPNLVSNSPFIVAGYVFTGRGTETNTYNVIDSSANQVVDTSINTVVADIESETGITRTPKYLICNPESSSSFKYTFGDFNATQDAPSKFMDWYTKDSVGIEPTTLPYLITGYSIVGGGSHVMQSPYIITFMKKTEDGFTANGDNLEAKNRSSATLQGRWHWTDSANASRWSAGEEVYRRRHIYVPADANDTYDDGYPVIVAKSKLRGRGNSLHLKWTSSSGKDMQISGWSIVYNINANV